MSAAFDTIDRKKLIEIIESFADEDEIRLVSYLLWQTTLEVKMNGISETISFESNVGAFQGDSLSGPLFTLYFENALKDLRTALQIPLQYEHDYSILDENRIDVYDHDHGYTNAIPSIPDEMIYADDGDFLSEKQTQQEKLNVVGPEILKKYNLLVNTDKTENQSLKRGNRNTELWRNSKKLGSLLGDIEDIARRKQLAVCAMNDMNKIWLQHYKKISLSKRLHLFGALVKSVLVYNSSCWGLRNVDSNNLNSFHRRLLRKVCKIYWPNNRK